MLCGDFFTTPHWCDVVEKSPHHTERNNEIGDFKLKSGAFLVQKRGFSFLLHSVAGSHLL